MHSIDIAGGSFTPLYNPRSSQKIAPRDHKARHIALGILLGMGVKIVFYNLSVFHWIIGGVALVVFLSSFAKPRGFATPNIKPQPRVKTGSNVSNNSFNNKGDPEIIVTQEVYSNSVDLKREKKDKKIFQTPPTNTTNDPFVSSFSSESQLSDPHNKKDKNIIPV